MKKILIFLGIIFCFVLQVSANSEDTIKVSPIKRPPLAIDSVNKMKKKYVDLLLQRDITDTLSIPFQLMRQTITKSGDGFQLNKINWDNKVINSTIGKYIEDIDSIGRFKLLMGNNPDSLYAYVDHAGRIVDIVMLYTLHPDSIAGLSDTIHLITDYLLENIEAKTFKSKGWYSDSLYVPLALGKAALMFKDNLRGDERSKIIRLLNKPSNDNIVAQNKIWYQITKLQRALLSDTTEAAASIALDSIMVAHDSICSVLMQKNKDHGIQSDWCFHQHKFHVQQFGNYGIEFIKDITMLSQVFNEYPPSIFESKHMLAIDSLVREGYRYVLWNGLMDVPSIGRQVTKEGQLWGGIYTGQVAKRMYNFSDSACHNTGERILRENFVCDDSIQPFAGHKHFSRSDYTIHRTPKWMTSLRMSSDSVSGTEVVNGYNTKGYYQGDGATYTQINGKEFLYIYPLWDWRKLPGVTCYDSTGPIKVLTDYQITNKSGLVGGITIGNGGISAMELNRDSLKAHKMWIFTDSLMLCLGYVFASPGAKTTSIEQCRKQTDLLHLYNDTSYSVITDTCTFNCDSTQLFYHNSIGYVSWDSVVVSSGKRTGCWGDFLPIYPKNVTDLGYVVSLYIPHPADEESTYQYMLLPAMSQDEVRDFDMNRINVLRNDSVMQAVLFDDKVYVAAFAPDTVKIDKYRNYIISEPGIYYYDSYYYQVFDMDN